MFKLKPPVIFRLLAYALPNTILSFGIVYTINNALSGQQAFLKDYIAIFFLSLIVYTYLLNVVFQKWLNKYSFTLLYENEKQVFGKILNTRLQKLEELGSHRFFSVIEDLRTFSLLPFAVTHTVNSLLMIVLCVVYMFTLSTVSALIVIGLICLVAGCYFIVIRSMAKQVTTLRGFNEHYYKYVDDVMKGFKELRLSFFRRGSLMNNFLIPNRNQAMDLDFRINYVFLSINLISQYGLYLVVAIILFVLPAIGLLERTDVISYVVIILFISGPINNLINLQQLHARFLAANARIKKFNADFGVTHIEPAVKDSVINSFHSLGFRNIFFSYRGEGTFPAFSLGPVNLNIQAGETIFIVGGNGSGKSTFINILTGLYKPVEGDIILNGTVLTDGEGSVQDLIAAVFTDNHIFSNNYDPYVLEKNETYKRLLKLMKLNEVIPDDREESARRRLSKGQSKRISLIFALLENKPLIVLDEWAADQDPHFRKFFYEELLPGLKEEGKTIIAVTHDDAYFHLADRVLKFEYGNIVKDVRTADSNGAYKHLWV